ncbi:MAG: hypothetical protein RLZZ458_691 [Planctomycetota bacterium]
MRTSVLNRQFLRRLALMGICMLGSCPACLAGDNADSAWSSFRNGGTSTAEGTYPQAWSASSGIAWQKELEGYGQSSPVVFGQHVFVSTVIGPQKDECCLTCYDIATGDAAWSFRHAASTTAPSNYSASRAAPTPLVDAAAVYAFFEGGDVFAVGHDGKMIWHRSLTSDYGKFENNHGLGSSPAQTDDMVVINVEHRGPSYLLALNKKSGDTVWKTERPSGSSWTSPIVANTPKGMQVIVSSGGAVTAYDPANGSEVWTLGGLAGNSVPSPVYADSRLYVGARVPEFGSTQEAAQSNLCLQLNPPEGTEHQVLWRASKAFCDYASPVVNGDCVYYLNNVGVLYCLNAQTGDVHYTERLGTTCWATPVVSGDLTYFFGKDGTTQVVRTGSSFEKVSTNLLWDPMNPPKPETYTEAEGSAYERGAGDGDGSASTSQESPGQPQSAGSTEAGAGRRSGRGAGMLAAITKGDANGDGIITEQELPAEFREMLPRIDLNGDKSLDAAELKAMEESFRRRREGSRDSARDPIVYGVAAVNGTFLVRTGTRLYCIRETK